MKQRIRDEVREFFDDPLGTAVRWAVYIVLLGVGVAVVVWAVRLAFNMRIVF